MVEALFSAKNSKLSKLIWTAGGIPMVTCRSTWVPAVMFVMFPGVGERTSSVNEMVSFSSKGEISDCEELKKRIHCQNRRLILPWPIHSYEYDNVDLKNCVRSCQSDSFNLRLVVIYNLIPVLTRIILYKLFRSKMHDLLTNLCH